MAAGRFTATLLGIGGAVPFIAFTPSFSPVSPLPAQSESAASTSISSVITNTKRAMKLPVHSAAGSHDAQIAYAACIVSFLGAVHWGMALGDGKHAVMRYSYSVIPSVLAWMGLVSTEKERISRGDAMMGLLAGCYAIDGVMSMNKLLPSWYMSLRTPLTIIGVTSMYSSRMMMMSESADIEKR